MARCAICYERLGARSNHWISVADGAERVCLDCKSWAHRTIKKLMHNNMMRFFFPEA